MIGIDNRDDKESDFTRDVANDIIKGIGCNNSKSVRKHALRLRKIERIEFIGSGTIKNSYCLIIVTRLVWFFISQNQVVKRLIDEIFRHICSMLLNGFTTILLQKVNGQLKLKRSSRTIQQ